MPVSLDRTFMMEPPEELTLDQRMRNLWIIVQRTRMWMIIDLRKLDFTDDEIVWTISQQLLMTIEED